MFFYRYKVVESHLNKYAGLLHEKYTARRSVLVATAQKNIQIHKFYDRAANEHVYFALDASSPSLTTYVKPSRAPHPVVLGFCSLSPIPRWVAKETSMLYVNPLSRGKGIATILYDAIMKDGVIVMSGYSHNPKSRRLWMNIVQNPKYATWAHDIVNLDRFADISVEDDTFECALKIYEDIKKMRKRRRQDVRIMAYNPRYLPA